MLRMIKIICIVDRAWTLYDRATAARAAYASSTGGILRVRIVFFSFLLAAGHIRGHHMLLTLISSLKGTFYLNLRICVVFFLMSGSSKIFLCPKKYLASEPKPQTDSQAIGHHSQFVLRDRFPLYV